MIIPPVTRGLPCDTLTAPDGRAYMRRYYLRSRRARYHHILASDYGEDFHDHPWDFTSRLLSGAYVEHTPDGSVRYEAPCVIVREAGQLHRLELPDGPVWSYVTLGPVCRTWGFMTADGWVPWTDYPAGPVTGCGPQSPRVRGQA